MTECQMLCTERLRWKLCHHAWRKYAKAHQTARSLLESANSPGEHRAAVMLGVKASIAYLRALVADGDGDDDDRNMILKLIATAQVLAEADAQPVQRVYRQTLSE